MKGTFATAINCMDGRVQAPVSNWIKEKYSVDYVDNITEPGPNGILFRGNDESLLSSIRRRVDISVVNHGSKVIVIAAHHDCAGNPVSKEEHIEHVKEAIKTVDSWGYDVELAGLWVDEHGLVYQVS